MAKIKHVFNRAFKSSSKFGVLEFDQDGFLIKPELTDEQKAVLLQIPGFSKVEDEVEEEDGLNDQQDGLELPEDLKELKTVPQLRKYAKDNNIEIEGTKKDEILAEILEALKK